MDILPVDMEHITQEHLKKPVTAFHLPCHLPAQFGQVCTLVRLVVHESLVRKGLECFGDTCRRYFHAPGNRRGLGNTVLLLDIQDALQVLFQLLGCHCIIFRIP